MIEDIDTQLKNDDELSKNGWVLNPMAVRCDPILDTIPMEESH